MGSENSCPLIEIAKKPWTELQKSSSASIRIPGSLNFRPGSFILVRSGKFTQLVKILGIGEGECIVRKI